MSQTPFFFFFSFLQKSKSNKKNQTITCDFIPKKKKKSKPITHINNSDHTKQKKYFAGCVGIPTGKVELAQFVRSKKRNGGSFSSHLYNDSILFFPVEC